MCLSLCPIASVRMYLFCLSYRVSAHESVLWRACYLCRYSASRWHHSSIYSSYSFHSSIYSSCFHASLLSLSLSLSFSHILPLFSCICTLSLSLSTYSMAMMESARLCRLLFAISFSLSEFRCEITFLYTLQEAGAERERQCGVWDLSDQDASDDDGDQQSDF